LTRRGKKTLSPPARGGVPRRGGVVGARSGADGGNEVVWFDVTLMNNIQ
jgi:hypothetical protein